MGEGKANTNTVKDITVRDDANKGRREREEPLQFLFCATHLEGPRVPVFQDLVHLLVQVKDEQPDTTRVTRMNC